MIALALLLAAGQTAPAAQGERWSILTDSCPAPQGDEVVVCAQGESAARLPLPDERPPPNRPRVATGDPRAALDNSGPPCPPTGCTGVSLPIIPIIAKLVEEVGYAVKGKHPGKREPIPLD